MNIWIASIIWAAVVVVAGVLMSKLFIRLWNFACPHVPPAPRSPLPQDRTTAAAAKMVAAAILIEERLYEADSIGCLLEDDELIQLTTARIQINRALCKLQFYEEREVRMEHVRMVGKSSAIASKALSETLHS